MRSTYITKPAEIKREWFIIDAKDQTLGRLSVEIAKILRGKNKVTYMPHVDTGDYVIIINAKNIKVTGKKLNQKFYRHHSGYPGGVKDINLKDMLERRLGPEYILKHAIKGMLPKNNLGHDMLKKLFVYAGPEHKHQAQKPKELVLSSKN